MRCLTGVGGPGLVPVRQLNLFRRFFRQTRFCAFFPLGGGGTCIARRIASSNLIGFSGFKNFGTGISSSEFFPTNDPSSATRPTRGHACNQSAMAGFAAAHG
jgi:hypothetical protein